MECDIFQTRGTHLYYLFFFNYFILQKSENLQWKWMSLFKHAVCKISDEPFFDKLLWSLLLIYQQIIHIPIGKHFAPLLADLFLYLNATEFLKHISKTTNIEAKLFNLTFRYIDYVVSINNSYFANCIQVIYSKWLEINEITEIASAVSHLDILYHIRHQMSIF